MPTLKKQIRSKRDWTLEHYSQLQSGYDFLGGGWGDELRPHADWPDADERHADMVECWQTNRDEIIRQHVEKFPCTRPWFYWQHERKRDETTAESWQLFRAGELADVEIAETLRHWQDGLARRHFRRPIGWWLHASPVPKSFVKTEAQQLVELHRAGHAILTGAEVYYSTPPATPAKKTTMEYTSRLEPAEYRFLGYH